jgi:hypothetical protein
MQYMQSFIQSLLGRADYLLLVIISLNYRSSLETWTVVLMTAAKFKPFIFSEHLNMTFEEYNCEYIAFAICSWALLHLLDKHLKHELGASFT